MSKWEWKKLGEVCDSINGLWKGKKEPFIKIGVIRNTNFTKNCRLDMNPSKLEFLDVEKKQYDKRKLLFGDLIVEKSGGSEKQPVGRVVLFEEKEGEYSFSNFTSVLRIKNDDEIECHFLHLQLYKLYLDGVTKQMQSATTGIHNLDFDQFKDLSIGIPPLSEQKRIVKFLDEEFSKIETLKTNAETNLKNVKDLFKVELLKEFSTTLWEKKKLGEVYNFIDYRGVTPNKLKEGIPLITAKNVRMGYIDYSVRDFISESDYKKRQSRGIAHKGDILFTTEAPLGFSAIADLDVFSTGQRVIVFQQFKNEKNICNPFFNWCFQSIEFQRMIKENATGLTATGIKASRLKEIKIPLPPLSVQKEIVARLDKLFENVKRLEANYKQIIANCDELKKSILKKTFEGDSRSSRE